MIRLSCLRPPLVSKINRTWTLSKTTDLDFVEPVFLTAFFLQCWSQMSCGRNFPKNIYWIQNPTMIAWVELEAELFVWDQIFPRMKGSGHFFDVYQTTRISKVCPLAICTPSSIPTCTVKVVFPRKASFFPGFCVSSENLHTFKSQSCCPNSLKIGLWVSRGPRNKGQKFMAELLLNSGRPV